MAQLKKELRSNTPTRLIGHHLKRSPGAVQQKASSLGLSTKPTNKSPFGTGGKRRGRWVSRGGGVVAEGGRAFGDRAAIDPTPP